MKHISYNVNELLENRKAFVTFLLNTTSQAVARLPVNPREQVLTRNEEVGEFPLF